MDYKRLEYYIATTYQHLRPELTAYIMSDMFETDVDVILSRDNTIPRQFAGEAAIDQRMDEITHN